MQKPTEIIKPEDILEIAIRRRWLILVPLAIALLVGIYYAFTLPRTYEASTTILVQPQSVPKDYVRSVVTVDLESRLSTIRQQILSRTTLEKLIEQYGLFSEPKYERLFIEDQLEILRNRISVNVSRGRRDTNTFSISYRGREPGKVMQIANTLAGYFIDENLKVRENQAIGTQNFLDDELEDVRQRLTNIENIYKQYRQTHMGELPEQLQSNLTILQRLQDQLTTNEESLREIKTRLAIIQKQIMEGREISDIAGNAVPEQATSLELMRKQLAELQSRYTDQHPDIIRIKTKIAEMEKQNYSRLNSAPEEDIGANVYNDPIIQQKAELTKEKSQLEDKISEINQQINIYQRRVENAPKREQELISLKRDYSNIQNLYNSLLNRKLEAQLSVSMERKQKGEQFHVLDPARKPNKPVSPDMKQIFMYVLVAGLGIGGGLIVLLEFMDKSYKKPEQIESFLHLPVIAVIPKIRSKKDIRKHRIEIAFCSLFGFFTAGLFGILAFIVIKGNEQTLDAIKLYVKNALQ